jgi:hypothetical protein
MWDSLGMFMEKGLGFVGGCGTFMNCSSEVDGLSMGSRPGSINAGVATNGYGIVLGFVFGGRMSSEGGYSRGRLQGGYCRFQGFL